MDRSDFVRGPRRGLITMRYRQAASRRCRLPLAAAIKVHRNLQLQKKCLSVHRTITNAFKASDAP